MIESTAEQVIVGKITAVYGVKGWVKIHSYTDPDTNLLQFRHLRMQRGDEWLPIEIDEGRRHGKGLAVHVVGCDDRNAAALLTQCELAVDVGELPEAADDEVYWRELEGMDVYAQGDGGAGEPVLLGKIEHLFATGANDVMVVTACPQSIDGRERLIPWVAGRHVLNVDRDARKVLVDWDIDF
jgi:16S rRNA processing protein RimM